MFGYGSDGETLDRFVDRRHDPRHTARPKERLARRRLVAYARTGRVVGSARAFGSPPGPIACGSVPLQVTSIAGALLNHEIAAQRGDVDYVRAATGR